MGNLATAHDDDDDVGLHVLGCRVDIFGTNCNGHSSYIYLLLKRCFDVHKHVKESVNTFLSLVKNQTSYRFDLAIMCNRA